ncbi:MAG: CAP domain-containing protein [Acutalibacteraceae bacterium]|jgi:uncharacterized protein YkwD
MRKRAVSFLICIALLFTLVACNRKNTESDSGNKNLSVTIDINPSIKIDITPSNVVHLVTAVNDDGKAILKDNKYSNKSLQYVSKNVISDLVSGGYINNADKSTILLTFNSLKSDKTDKIKSEIESAIKSAGYSADIYTLYITSEDKEIKKLAEKSNISYGKAYFCTIVAENSNGTIEVEKMVTDDISQIKDKGEKHKVSVSDIVDKANKKVEVSESQKVKTTKTNKTTTNSNKSTTKTSTTKPKTTKPTTTRTKTTKPSTTKSSTTQVPPAKRTPTADELEVFRLINEERKNEGLAELKWTNLLFSCAVIRSGEILTDLGHGIPDGSSCAPVKNVTGFTNDGSYITESIARCLEDEYSPAFLHQTLMESPSHKNVILNTTYTRIGIAIIKGNDGYYYIVEEFYA